MWNGGRLGGNFFCTFFSAFCVLALANALQANASTAEDSEAFASCVKQLMLKAKEASISSATIDQTLTNVSHNPRVIELDRQQPEFTTSFADYLNRRVTQDRIKQGRALLKQHRQLLDDASARFGVPARYLVAFWGLETNYGRFLGKMNVPDSLTTLACDPRRSDYFTSELIDALKIIDEGIVAPQKMEGSWAGAMGHVQFMPSAYRRYALDYDGDGKRDLWRSLPDAMGSAAHFLQNLGWEKGARWGREVLLPDNFDYLQAGLTNSQPLAEWKKLGIRQADGSPLPQADIAASLLVPSGHQGPAFMVYDNFNVIMRWNRSEFYALSVGYLADRINGAGALRRAPPENVPRLHRDQVIALQEKLLAAGFDLGEADGIFGPASRRALSQFQQQQNLIADGFPGEEVLKRLGIN